ncbi:MMPL family transporter, partial [Vibrio parahaemolyticus]
IKRYGLQHSWRVLLPSLIACACGLATAVAMGTTLNLFNLLGLVLILGIGIDYTLFFAEKARSVSTLLAITLSAITTVLSFGLLSLSQTHAIHSFGITVLSGIFVAWLLSPIAIKTEETTS